VGKQIPVCECLYLSSGLDLSVSGGGEGLFVKVGSRV